MEHVLPGVRGIVGDAGRGITGLPGGRLVTAAARAEHPVGNVLGTMSTLHRFDLSVEMENANQDTRRAPAVYTKAKMRFVSRAWA